jgi:ATP-dependent Clp protease ATP-binding subunit ClpC
MMSFWHSNMSCADVLLLLLLRMLQVTKDKDAAVRGQDFEKAGQLRDREMELKAKISAIIAGAKEQGKAEAESVEGGGPQVRHSETAV